MHIVQCPYYLLQSIYKCSRDHLNNARMLELFQKRNLSEKQSTCLIDMAIHMDQSIIATIMISHIWYFHLIAVLGTPSDSVSSRIFFKATYWSVTWRQEFLFFNYWYQKDFEFMMSGIFPGFYVLEMSFFIKPFKEWFTLSFALYTIP